MYAFCLYECMCTVREPGVPGARKSMSSPPEQEWQEFVSPMWILETQLEPSARVACAPNCWAISPDLD